MKFGEAIKKRRIDLGFTMTHVAKEVGISLPFVSDIEKGNRLLSNVETFNKFVEVLDLESKKWKLLYQLCFERNNIELFMIQGLLDDGISIFEVI